MKGIVFAYDCAHSKFSLDPNFFHFDYNLSKVFIYLKHVKF